MEATCPKKRRSEALHTDKFSSSPALASGDASDPPPAREMSKEPPEPGAGGEEQGAGVDWISRLPDSILGEIITLLPTKDGARTQILATRWRHIWRSAPLNINDCDLPRDEGAAAGVISRILSAHQGPGRSFIVSTRHFQSRPAVADAWLRSPALANLQQISFCLPLDSTFSFSATLRDATISNCLVTDIAAQMVHLPQLTKLTLSGVNVPEAALHSVFSGCPVLEYLLIKNCTGFRCVRVTSSSLRSIGVSIRPHPYSESRLEELIIEDAPSLEKLLYSEEYGLNVSILSAPKLETLGCFQHRIFVVAGSTTFQGLQGGSLSTVMCGVKTLAVSSQFIWLDTIVDLMKYFPCLENLYVRPFDLFGTNLWRRKHKKFIQSTDIRLKTIVLGKYRGINPQVSFASFFIHNAKELQRMRIEVDGCYYNNEFFAEQHRALGMEKRASRAAQLDFEINTCCSIFVHLHVNHISDLFTVNPFECRSRL